MSFPGIQSKYSDNPRNEREKPFLFKTYHFHQQKFGMLYPRDGFHQKIELIFVGLLLVLSLTRSFDKTARAQPNGQS